jgi:hypothetical protein
LSPKLLETSIRYGNNIAIWANKVETRYKEFFNIMSKVQHTYGLQITSASASNLISPLSLKSPLTPTSTSCSSLSINSATYQSENTSSAGNDSEKMARPILNVTETNKQQEILKHNEQKQKLIRKRQLVSFKF